MLQCLLKRLDKKLVSLLKQRAASRGHSAEKEHRLILKEALVGVSTRNASLSFAEYLSVDSMPDVEISAMKRNQPSERDAELGVS